MLLSIGINPMPLNAKFGTPVVKKKAVRRRPKAGCQPRTCARRIVMEADDLCRQETLIVGNKTAEKSIIFQRFMRVKGKPANPRRRRTLCGRSIDLRLQVEEALCKLKDLGFESRSLGIEMWLDESTVGRFPMVMVCWKFLFDDAFAQLPETTLAELRKTHICTLVPGSEQREDLALVFNDVFCPQIRDLERSRIGETQVLLKLFLCDNKAIQTIMGLNNGNYSCCCCYISRCNLHCALSGVKSPLRTLRTVRRGAAADDVLAMGDGAIPLLYDEQGLCAPHVTVGVDTLRVIENVGTALLLNVFSTVHNGRSSLKNLLKSFLPHLGVEWNLTNTTCANIRDFFMLYEHILVKNTVCTEGSDDSVAAILEAVQYFRDVICLLYSPPVSRSALIVLHLHARVMMFSHAVKKAFPPSTDVHALYGLPFHQLVAHLPALSRQFFLVDLSTETFESQWRAVREHEQNYSSHRGDVVKKFLLHVYFQEQLLSKFGASQSG